MAKINQFSAPGNLKDFDGDMAAGRSQFISDDLDREIASLANNAGLQPQFYNPSKLDVTGTPTPIGWPAFPQIIADYAPSLAAEAPRAKPRPQTKTKRSTSQPGPKAKGSTSRRTNKAKRPASRPGRKPSGGRSGR